MLNQLLAIGISRSLLRMPLTVLATLALGKKYPQEISSPPPSFAFPLYNREGLNSYGGSDP